MIIKKSAGHIIGANLTNAEKKALDIEIRRCMANYLERAEIKIEAQVLYQLKQQIDMNDEDLKKFYMEFGDGMKLLVEHYEMAEEDGSWLAMQMLKADGIDIEAWSKEKDELVGIRPYKEDQEC